MKLETRPRSLGLATRSMRKKSVRVPNAYHMDGLERSGLGHEQRQLGADPTASRSLPTNVKMETSSSRFPRAKNVVSVPESNVLDNEEVQTAEEVEGFTVSKPNSGASAGNSDSNRDLAGTTRGVRNETRPGISLYPPGDSYRDHLASEAEESSMPAFDSEHAALHPGLPQEPNDIDLEGITNDSAPVVGNSMPRGISQLQRRNDLSPTCGKVDLHAIKLEACRRAARAGLDPCPEDEGPRKKPRFNVLRHILCVFAFLHSPSFQCELPFSLAVYVLIFHRFRPTIS